MVNLSLKCGHDWLKDEEVENRKVIIIFFLVLALVCFDIETSCRRSYEEAIDKTIHIYKGLSQQ